MGTDFDDGVELYLMGTSPFESIEQLDESRREKDLPWPVAYPGKRMLEALDISSQACIIALGGDGYQNSSLHGVGRGDYDSWRYLFDEIASN